MAENLTTAIMLTGAAARISQEVALIDKLRANKGLTLKETDTFVSGFSSGSLNLAAINTCFRSENPLSWDEYYKKEILFKLKISDVFKLKFPLPLDTRPLRKTLNKFLASGNFTWCKDLPFRSYILTFSRAEFETLWACSRDNNEEYLNLSDLFMSSTAIPLIFPAQEIHCEEGHTTDFPGGKYNDGGTGGTFKRFPEYLGKYVEENQPFKKLYIISPMRERTEKDIHEAFDHLFKNNKKKTHIQEANLGNISFHTFMKFLVKLNNYNKKHKVANEIYVSIPDMKKNFPILNFNKQEKQYNAVCDWVDANPDQLAIPLEKFINS